VAKPTKSKGTKRRSRKKPQRYRKLRIGIFAGILLGSLSGLSVQTADLYAHPQLLTNDQLSVSIRQDLAHDFRQLAPQIRSLVDDQIKYNIEVAPNSAIQLEITNFSVAYESRDYKAARTYLNQLRADYTAWRHKLDDAVRQQALAKARSLALAAPVRSPAPSATFQIPIVIYHHPPADFEQQLQYLAAHRYTTINPDQLAAAILGHSALPAKPILITFDDGFSDQLQAFSLLQKYGMTATFYIIDGGPNSRYCIGAGRRYGDPLQPIGGCGDAYLSWDQIRQLDQSGIITIGSHTIDHPNLATMTPDQQRYEIIEGKAQLEAQLGHPVHSFAYPYGSYNATSINLVKEAGFTTAVTTLPGTLQSAGRIDELFRIRLVTNLP
jgi:peptidoglycan/xylan/chitin deacetylase (PgdA/CDA1 family)